MKFKIDPTFVGYQECLKAAADTNYYAEISNNIHNVSAVIQDSKVSIYRAGILETNPRYSIFYGVNRLKLSNGILWFERTQRIPYFLLFKVVVAPLLFIVFLSLIFGAYDAMVMLLIPIGIVSAFAGVEHLSSLYYYRLFFSAYDGTQPEVR